ncbi:unnamed protein product [Caenorhabditis auriculariae]|uniref:Uncharacterized protein n=1 Tax=Caenorhabditis auriculariae TaxID=2777116 RepID=A0A8S1GPB0_9PELO|nr:unnamed protein product [Caenorhabditis auriculariae]
MSREKYTVPDGLRPLLEALARETIRAQPKETTPAPRSLPTPLPTRCFVPICNDDLPKKKTDQERCESPLDQAATKIQAAFKGHLVRAHPEKFGVEKVMSRTQSSEKMEAFNNRKDLKRHSVGGYSIESDSPEDRAATKIQAEIRGFLARKQVEKMKKEDNDAAVKIQARIRGFLTRKHLDEQGLLSPSRSRSSLHSNNSDDH